MAQLQWNDNLSVGIEQIDDQHRQWIEYYNNAAQAVAAHQDQTLVAKTLGFLIDYTEVHFSTEEKQMVECDYPERSTHKVKHDELRNTLANLTRDYEEEGVHRELASAIDTFLGNWLIQHIQDVDKKFGAFVKSQS
ncbi:bacteriohemerythrin [Planctomycetota bacterium]